MSTRQAGLLKSGVSTFAGVVFGALATFTLTGVISNVRGADDTGLYFQAIALFAIATSALQLGADTALVRSLSRQVALGQLKALRPTVWQAALPVLAFGVLAAAGAWAGADALGSALSPDSADRMAALIRTAAPFLPPSALLVVLLGGTRGVGSTLPYTLTFNVALPLLRLVGVAVAVYLGIALQGVIALWAAPVALLTAVTVAVLARQVHHLATTDQGPDESPADPRAFWSFALPRGASTLIERGLDWGGVLIVLAIAGPVQGAIYAVVNRCASAGSMIDQAARVVTGPRISRALAVGDHSAAEAMFLTVTRGLILLSWPFYLTLAVFSPVVLSLFGAEFVSGAAALTLVALSLMVATSAGMVQSILLMGGRSSWQLMNRSIQLVILLGLTLALVPPLGIVGAALAWIAAIAVDTVLATTQVALRMRIRSSVRLIALPAVIALAAFGVGGGLAAAVFGERLATLVIALPLLGVVYAGAVWVLRKRLGLPLLSRSAGSSRGTRIPRTARTALPARPTRASAPSPDGATLHQPVPKPLVAAGPSPVTPKETR